MLDKSIDFLMENAGPVIQYRLRKEILQNITKTEEENLLGQIYQMPYFKLVESYAKPNGFIGVGMHGHSNWRGVKLHETPLQCGEAAARLLSYYAVPKNHPLVANYISVMRNDDILRTEFAYNNSATQGFNDRFNSLGTGSGLMVIIYTLQAMLGYGDDACCHNFQNISLNAFCSVLKLPPLDDIMEFDPHSKKKYNYPYITVDSYFPCVYHLTMMAHTHSWRTPANTQALTNAINHICEIMPEGTENNTIRIKSEKGFVGTYWAIIQPFTPFRTEGFNVTMGRRILTEIAMSGVGRKADVIRKSADTVEEALAADGVLRARTPYNVRWPGAYGEIFLEPDYRKKKALDCDMTFWAVQFLTLVNRGG